MKNYLISALLLVFLTSPNSLLAQEDARSKYSIQLDLGLLSTLHYNQPVSLNQCIEGCIPEDQDSKLAPAFGLSLYRDFDSKNSLKIGFGISSYRYDEVGQGGVGDGTLSRYQTTTQWDFYGISAGYRYIFNPEEKITLFFEGDIIYEIPTQGQPLLQNAVAIQPKIGALWRINEKWSLVAEGVFKSAFTTYSNKEHDRGYNPYAYGLQAGINFGL